MPRTFAAQPAAKASGPSPIPAPHPRPRGTEFLGRSGAARLMLALLTVTASAAAQTVDVEIAASADTTLFQEDGDASNGAGPHNYTGRINGGVRRRALLRFAVEALPSGATIEAACVEVTVNREPPGAPGETFGLHQLTAAFGEAGSDAGTPGGQGAPAMTGDSTWTHRIWPDTLWSTAGGDYAAMPSSSVFILGEGPYLFESTPQLVADLQAAIDDPSANFGLALVADEGVLQLSAKRVASRENPIVSSRPRLLLRYREAVIFADGFESNVAATACPAP